MDNNIDSFFNDKTIKKALMKKKIKSYFKIIGIFVILSIFSLAFNSYYMRKVYMEDLKEIERVVALTIPNGYISKSTSQLDFFNGMTSYTISKGPTQSGLSLDYEERTSAYGPFPPSFQSSVETRSLSESGKWPINLNSKGYKSMILFHPEITYKEYPNDLKLIDKLKDNQVAEVTLSLDKVYKPHEIDEIISDSKVSWILLDGYSDSVMEEFKMEANEYDAKASFIKEFEFVGFKNSPSTNICAQFRSNYDEFITNLNAPYKSQFYKERFKNTHDSLVKKNNGKVEDTGIIGVVVYGNKDQLKNLLLNPHIKASSIGVIYEKKYLE